MLLLVGANQSLLIERLNSRKVKVARGISPVQLILSVRVAQVALLHAHTTSSETEMVSGHNFAQLRATLFAFGELAVELLARSAK